ncbi:MAG TPA: PqqD family peptide modification chaperone [Rhodoblastus sp.]|nr:PqqD family peptide modification chaperone [Rhodoblastus sp.]
MGQAERKSFDQFGTTPTYLARAAKDVVFALIDGEATLFSETAQELHALNPVAALIWCRLDESGDPNDACAGLVEAGVEPVAAARHVDDAIREWLERGLFRADFPPMQRRHACAFQIDDEKFVVETADRDLSRQIAGMFDPDPSWTVGVAARFQVVDVGDSLHVHFEDRRIAVCDAVELLPTIKALATARILARPRREIMFHAACLTRGDRTLLLSGAPGTGKTTLALHLVANGFLYGGDDIALIAPDGSVRGLPLAPTVKSGAWPIVARLRPDLASALIHRRPDGEQAKYLALGAVDSAPHPAGWLVFLRRAPGAGVEFAPLDGVEAMRRVIEGAYSSSQRLSLAGFRALRRMLAGARSVELVYERSDDAAAALCDFCYGQR